jgi:hypothetical protein
MLICLQVAFAGVLAESVPRQPGMPPRWPCLRWPGRANVFDASDESVT